VRALVTRAERKAAAAYEALIDRLDAGEARRLFREVETLLRKAVEGDGRLAAAWRGLAEVYELLGDGERAREAQVRYVAAAEFEGEEAVDYTLELLLRGGHLPLARALLSRTDRQGPDAEQAWRELRKAERRAEDAPLDDEEIVALKEYLYDAGVLELAPGRVHPRNNCDGTFRLTDAWLAKRGIETKAAHEFFEGLCEKSCDCEVLLGLEPLGIVDSVGHWKAFAARRAYWKGRTLFEQRSTRANSLIADGKYEAALEIWDELAAMDPEDERLLLLRGKCFQELKRAEEAEGSFRRLLQLNPEYGFGHFALGSLLQETGRLEEAEQAYRKGLETDPKSAALHCGLVAALIESGRTKEAAAAARRGLEHAPDDEELRRLFDVCGGE